MLGYRRILFSQRCLLLLACLVHQYCTVLHNVLHNGRTENPSLKRQEETTFEKRGVGPGAERGQSGAERTTGDGEARRRGGRLLLPPSLPGPTSGVAGLRRRALSPSSLRRRRPSSPSADSLPVPDEWLICHTGTFPLLGSDELLVCSADPAPPMGSTDAPSPSGLRPLPKGFLMAGEEASVVSSMFDHHFSLVKSKYGQHSMKPLSTILLGLRDTTVSRKKGIKLSPGAKFRYCNMPDAEKNNKVPQKKRSLYLYEAGVHPSHTQIWNDDISIYVTRDDESSILVGTLSASHPCIPLELTLGEDCVLTHNATRKTVFFNGFFFTLAKSPKLVVNKEVWSRAKPIALEAKEFWAMEVLPSQKLYLDPVGVGKEYHLLEVYAKKNTDKNIDFHVCCNEKIKLLGELVAGCSRIRLHSVFHDATILSHNSNTTSLFFSGYMVRETFDFKLKELNDYNDDSSMVSWKMSLDPEYQCYMAKLAKGPTGKVNLPEDGKKRATETHASDKKAKIGTPPSQRIGDKKIAGNNSSSSSKPKGESPKSIGTYACKLCSRTFLSNLALRSHKKARHP